MKAWTAEAAARFVALRKKQRYTLRSLSEALNKFGHTILPAQLNRFEHGKVPNINDFAAICAVLQVGFGDILDLQELGIASSAPSERTVTLQITGNFDIVGFRAKVD